MCSIVRHLESYGIGSGGIFVIGLGGYMPSRYFGSRKWFQCGSKGGSPHAAKWGRRWEEPCGVVSQDPAEPVERQVKDMIKWVRTHITPPVLPRRPGGFEYG